MISASKWGTSLSCTLSKKMKKLSWLHRQPEKILSLLILVKRVGKIDLLHSLMSSFKKRLTFCTYRKCVFEILPMIHNSARKALQKSKAQGEELKRLREAAKKEVEDNEAIYAQMEGTPIRFGQIIQLSHPQSGIKYLTVSNSEAALLEHACAKLFFRFFHFPHIPISPSPVFCGV